MDLHLHRRAFLSNGLDVLGKKEKKIIEIKYIYIYFVAKLWTNFHPDARLNCIIQITNLKTFGWHPPAT